MTGRPDGTHPRTQHLRIRITPGMDRVLRDTAPPEGVGAYIRGLITTDLIRRGLVPPTARDAPHRKKQQP